MILSNISQEAKPKESLKLHLLNILDIKYDPSILSFVQAHKEVVVAQENEQKNEEQKQQDPMQEQQEKVEPQENTSLKEEMPAQKQEKLPATPPQQQITSIQQQLQKENLPLASPSLQALTLQPNDYQICKNLIKAVVNMRWDLQAARSMVTLMKELRKRPLSSDRNMAQQNEGNQEQNQGNHRTRTRTSKTTRRRFNKLMNRNQASTKETAENKNIDKETPNKEVRKQKEKQDQLCSLQNK